MDLGRLPDLMDRLGGMGVGLTITPMLEEGNAYNEQWQAFLGSNPGRDEVFDFGRQLSKDYGLEPGF